MSGLGGSRGRVHPLLLLGMLAVVGVVAFVWPTEDGKAGFLAPLQESKAAITPDPQPAATTPFGSQLESNREQVAASTRSAGAGGVALPEMAAQPFLDLEVTCFASGRSDAKPVADIAFEIRRKSFLFGDVVLASGRTDAEGTLRMRLGPSQFERSPSGKVRAMVGLVVEPGYQERATEIEDPLEAGGPYRLRLAALAGSTIRGQVVDEEGNAVRASVALQAWSMTRGVSKLRTLAVAKQRARRAFKLHLTPGARGILRAHAGDLGTAVLEDIDFEKPPQDLVMVVRGDGVLRGKIADTEGRVVEGLTLFVAAAEFGSVARPAALPEPLASEFVAEGRGITWSLPDMEDDGSFELEGLRPGNYIVRAALPEGGRRLPRQPDSYPLVLTPHAVPADGVPLDLQLKRPHIVVHMNGELLSFGRRSLSYPRFNGLSARQGWPAWPSPIVIPCKPSPTGDRVTDSSLFGWSASNTARGFDVKVARSYFVGAIGGGFDGTLQKVEVPWGSGRIDVHLNAQPDVPLGRVTVGVNVEGAVVRNNTPSLGYVGGGSSPPPRVVLSTEEGTEYRLAMHLEQLETGLIVMRRTGTGTDACTFEVPPGRYLAVVEGEVVSTRGTSLPPGNALRAEVEVMIVAGTDQELELDLTAD